MAKGSKNKKMKSVVTPASLPSKKKGGTAVNHGGGGTVGAPTAGMSSGPSVSGVKDKRQTSTVATKGGAAAEVNRNVTISNGNVGNNVSTTGVAVLNSKSATDVAGNVAVPNGNPADAAIKSVAEPVPNRNASEAAIKKVAEPVPNRNASEAAIKKVAEPVPNRNASEAANKIVVLCRTTTDSDKSAAIPMIPNKNSIGIKGKLEVSKGTLPVGYAAIGTGAEDVTNIYDFYHTSLDSSSKKFSNQFRDRNSSRGSHRNNNTTQGTFKSQLISSAVTQEPVVNVLEKGFDLGEVRKPWCCFGTNNQWNGRRVAHGLSTNFSSPRLYAEEEAHAKSADFISDWSNIKTLFKARGSDSHISYVLHRIGNSVTIDHLDLTSVLLLSDFSQLPPEFVNFIKKVVGNDRAKIIPEQRNKNVMAKEAFHKLLHASMKRPMKVDFSGRKGSRSSDSQFVHHVLFSTEKFKILTGSDTPAFVSELDEGSLTVYSNDGTNLNPLDAFDLWMDNKLLKCSKSLISHQKDWKITKAQFISTNDLPHIGKFDSANYMQHGEELLQILKDKVKPGSTYWLYRAPGKCDMNLFLISNVKDENQEASSTVPILDNWPLLEPYLPYFATATLTKYSESLSDAVVEMLTLETNYDPPDASVLLEGIVNNNNNSDGGAIKKIDVKSTGQIASNKILKSRRKLENMAKHLARYIPPPEDDGWIIQSLDEIKCKYFSRIVKCIKGIYTAAIEFTPNLQNSIYRHAVERYFPTCLKLIRAIGPTSERLKHWESDERLRQFIISFHEGIMSILVCLSDWHGQVNDHESCEWTYLAFRLNVCYADMFSSITRKEYEKKRVRMAVDAKSPAENHGKIIDLYQKALDQIPLMTKCFPVKHSFAASSTHQKDQIIQQEDLLDEINKKLARAYLNTARFHLAFPSFLLNVIGSPSNEQRKKSQLRSTGKTFYSRDGDDSIDQSALTAPDQLTRERIKHNNEKVKNLLEKCLKYADTVKLADECLNDVVATANATMGILKVRRFELDNLALLADHSKWAEKAAANIEDCLENVMLCEEGLTTTVQCNGGNSSDHMKAVKSAHGGKSVSDARVFLPKTFVNGEAIYEALDCFSRAAAAAEDTSKKPNIELVKDSLSDMLQNLVKDSRKVSYYY